MGQDNPTGDKPRNWKINKPPKVRYSIDQLREEVDEWGRRFYYTPAGRKVCGRRKHAKNRVIPDEACQAVPTREGPCRVHGAGGGAPIQSGRYSRVMRRWSKSFDRALGDEALLDTKPDVAAMDVLIEKLMRRAEFMDCPSWRADLRDTYGELQSAMRSRRQADVAANLQRLGELIENGATHDQMAGDLLGHIDKRANRAQKASELDLKREEKVTFNQLTAIFASWLAILQEHLEPKLMVVVVPALRKVIADRGIPGLEEGAASRRETDANRIAEIESA